MTKANQTLLVMSGDFILNLTVQFSKSAPTVKLENCLRRSWNVEGPLRITVFKKMAIISGCVYEYFAFFRRKI